MAWSDWLWLFVLLVAVAGLVVAIISLTKKKRGKRGRRGRTGSSLTGPTGTDNVGATGAYVGFSTNLDQSRLNFVTADDSGRFTIVLMVGNNNFTFSDPNRAFAGLDSTCISANRPGTLKDLSVVLDGGDAQFQSFGSGTGIAEIWKSGTSTSSATGWFATPLAVSWAFTSTGPAFVALLNNTDTVPVLPLDRFTLIVRTDAQTGLGVNQFQYGGCAAGLTYF